VIIYLCLFAVAVVAGGLGVYVGRVTAPECERQHHETQIVINRARLTKLDADGRPLGEGMDITGRMITMEFQAEADPAMAAVLFGNSGAAVEHDEPAFAAPYLPGPGESTGRHAAVEADEEVTQVVPLVGPDWPQSDDTWRA
jgi:hypothetical protein